MSSRFICVTDCLVLDTGINSDNGDRFFAVVSDDSTALVDNSGSATKYGNEIVSKLLNNNLDFNSETRVIGSYEVNKLDNSASVSFKQKVYAFNGGDVVLSLNSLELEEFMLDSGLLIPETDFIIDTGVIQNEGNRVITDLPMTMGVDRVIFLIVAGIVKFIKWKFPELHSYTAIIDRLISAYCMFNGIDQDAYNRIFDEVMEFLDV